jgi:hypothetical protein
MEALRNISAVAVLLATVACGPPRLGTGPIDETGTETDSNATSADTTTTSESSESTETDTSTETSTTMPFDVILEIDECDPWLQDCPEGEKCVPYASEGGSWEGNKCVPIMGDQPPGEPCTYGGVVEATDDCDASSACWNDTCHAFCTGTPMDPECPVGSTCVLTSNPVLTFCFFDCNPLTQNCAPENGCYWTGEKFDCVPSSEDLPAGESCEFTNACEIGTICVTAEIIPGCDGVGCCSPFCNLGLGGPECDVLPGTSCAPFFENMAPPNYEQVGICVMP